MSDSASDLQQEIQLRRYILMDSTTYRTAPVEIAGMPPGIPYIIGNEAAERFSYYGMKAILMVFMTSHLMADGKLSPMAEDDAAACYHWFLSANYALPVLGALIADLFWGKYQTIFWLSLVYCLGHVALSLDETRLGLFLGLALIAVGSGGIKPCVSAHLGDQFGRQNAKLLEQVYGWFYFSVNFGSMFSTLLTPWLLRNYGASVAFGVPAIFMLLATFVFWLGRKKYTHIPPRGMSFLKSVSSRDGIQTLLRLGLVFLFIAVFWSFYDQTGSKWVTQAQRMDRHFLDGMFGEKPWEWESSQIHAINPFLVMIFIPLFSYVIYPLAERVIKVTHLGKMTVGFFLATAACGMSGWIESQLDAGIKLNIAWQLGAFFLLTIAEVMIYFTGLEFSYTQAPPSMKSFIMALNVLSVSLGNAFTALLNTAISSNPILKSRLEGANYWWFFTSFILAASVLFVFVALNYRGRTYLQSSDDEQHA